MFEKNNKNRIFIFLNTVFIFLSPKLGLIPFKYIKLVKINKD
jgi:hypothetical protein